MSPDNTPGSLVKRGLASYQVFQRNVTGQAAPEILMNLPSAGELTVSVQDAAGPLSELTGRSLGTYPAGDQEITLPALPTGGPYELVLTLNPDKGEAPLTETFERILVGDLWVLAGQSNMEGVGNLPTDESPSELVNVFRMRYLWDEARDPIHRLYESVHPVHRPTPEIPSLEQANRAAKAQVKGAGLGLRFAKEMVAVTGVPVGLVPCAHGGTAMHQWNPELADQKGESLFGALVDTLDQVGHDVTGVLWYQGESDCCPSEAEVYTPRMYALVEALRRETRCPELPFYYVQLGCFAEPSREADLWWTNIREQQRLLENNLTPCGMVTAIDLALDDLIHISTMGQQVLGSRFAKLALGQVQAGPRLQEMKWTADQVLTLRFSGVNGGLLPLGDGAVNGFTFLNPEGVDARLIYKQQVSPVDQSVITIHIRTEELPFDLSDCRLVYGYGVMPVCNVVDEEGLALPAFGPLELPTR